MINRRRFGKKKILGMVKTYHAKQRQIQRSITDAMLAEVLLKGEFSERNGIVISYEGYHVHLSSDLERIITVIAPDKPTKSPKTISSEKGRSIIERIDQLNVKENEIAEEEMTFEDYMKKEFPKK